MNRSIRWRMLFFALMALLLIPELLFSNIGSLGRVAEVAQLLGLSESAERTRLYILIVLDAIGGLGALLAFLGYARRNPGWQQTGVLATTIGLILYGLYQILSAQLQLAAEWRMPITTVGVVYGLLGVVAWYVGKLRVGQSS